MIRRCTLIYKLILLTATLMVLFLFSCSGADPIIYQFDWYLQVSQNNTDNQISERLVINILADDDDGFDEIYEVYIINDDAQEYWRITSNEWTLFPINTVNWIAITNIYTNTYKKLPRGKYRLLLRDLSGYEDEKTFVIPDKDFRYTAQDIPYLTKQNENLFGVHFSNTPSEEGRNTKLLQLVHPSLDNISNNQEIAERQNIIQSLGTNGNVYTADASQDIYFLSETPNLNFESHLHYLKSPHLVLSSGPYKIRLE